MQGNQRKDGGGLAGSKVTCHEMERFLFSEMSMFRNEMVVPIMSGPRLASPRPGISPNKSSLVSGCLVRNSEHASVTLWAGQAARDGTQRPPFSQVTSSPAWRER